MVVGGEPSRPAVAPEASDCERPRCWAISLTSPVTSGKLHGWKLHSQSGPQCLRSLGTPLRHNAAAVSAQPDLAEWAPVVWTQALLGWYPEGYLGCFSPGLLGQSYSAQAGTAMVPSFSSLFLGPCLRVCGFCSRTGLNLKPLHWTVEFQPLDCQESPFLILYCENRKHKISGYRGQPEGGNSWTWGAGAQRRKGQGNTGDPKDMCPRGQALRGGVTQEAETGKEPGWHPAGSRISSTWKDGQRVAPRSA